MKTLAGCLAGFIGGIMLAGLLVWALGSAL
jgi:hypothetical protein